MRFARTTCGGHVGSPVGFLWPFKACRRQPSFKWVMFFNQKSKRSFDSNLKFVPKIIATSALSISKMEAESWRHLRPLVNTAGQQLFYQIQEIVDITGRVRSSSARRTTHGKSEDYVTWWCAQNLFGLRTATNEVSSVKYSSWSYLLPWEVICRDHISVSANLLPYYPPYYPP